MTATVTPPEPALRPGTIGSIRHVQSVVRATLNAADESNGDGDADDVLVDRDDNLGVEPLAVVDGYRMQFHFDPRSFVEYSIGLKATTDLCSKLEYFDAHQQKTYLQVSLTQQQECCAMGKAFTIIEKDPVGVAMWTDGESGIFTVTMHSPNRKAVQALASRFNKLCASNNFWRGQHLQARALGNSGQRPLGFLPWPGVEAVHGFEKVQKILNENVVRFFDCKKVHKITPQRGVMIHGRPGSGKSLLVRKTKLELLNKGITVIDLTTDGMAYITDWYAIAEKWLAPALIVLEDIDLIARHREQGNAAVTTDLLASLGGNNKIRKPIVTLATTNKPEEIDEAVKRSRRMDKILKVDGIEEQFKVKLLQRNGVALEEDELRKGLNLMGENVTGADLETVASDTILYASLGEDVSTAYKRSIEEWSDGHKNLKSVSLGFDR